MPSWCQRQAYQYFFLLAFTDVPMMLSDIFIFVFGFFFSFLKMYFISIAIILNKVIIFYKSLKTFFGGNFSDLQKLM